MKSNIIKTLIVLGLALVLAVAIYVIFAFFEGEKSGGDSGLPVDDRSVKPGAQGLLSGQYVVYTTVEPQLAQDKQIKIWRYYIGSGDGSQLVTSFTGNGQENFQKFSEESLTVWHTDTDKELWHINGQLLGPAESTSSVISPDRRWLVMVDKNAEHKFILRLQSISTGAAQEWLVENYTTGYLVPRDWTQNSRALYLTAQNEGEEPLPGLWVLDLNQEQIVEFDLVRQYQVSDITVYPTLKLAIGVTVEMPSRIMLIDLVSGEVTELMRNASHKFIHPQLASNGTLFSYTLQAETDSIWLADYINPQKQTVKPVSQGRLLAWPQDDLFVINQAGILQVYNEAGKNAVNLTAFANQAEWKFIGIFNIK